MIRVFITLFFLSLSVAANAQILVVGSGDAENCYKLTRDGNPGTSKAIETCRSALKMGLLQRDQAATHVNTGILYMRNGDYEESRGHYKSAINLSPELPEAYINYGAALIFMYETDDAIEALSKAIALDQTETAGKLPEALFNRSIAYNKNENYKAAYLDLRRALELRPDWAPALAAIKRYNVKKPS